MIDDVMECSAGLWLPHFEKFLKLLLQGAMDADPTTRQVLPAALCLAILTRRAVTFFFLLAGRFVRNWSCSTKFSGDKVRDRPAACDFSTSKNNFRSCWSIRHE